MNLKEAIAEYSKRLQKFCSLTITELADEKLPSKMNDSIAQEIKQKECSKIQQAIKKDSYVICLDLKGKQLSSEEFSKKIENIALNENSHITFIIGGTLGLTNELLKTANEKLPTPVNPCFSTGTII